MRKQVLFPLNGLSLEVNLVSVFYDDLGEALKEAQKRGYHEGKFVRVEGRQDNAAFRLEHFDPNVSSSECRIVSILEGSVVKYAIEKVKPED